ncbi:hypothetical protein BN946_scf184675.g4 [Trametes cinnabarina]|uniref:RNA-directed DNA polymerase n=1 Tax=Pycnoporus cinnabarinus TaxID=5643 RepID=A0A060SRJ3_PYCCI|nr:hypothetical protein BN946_scf184675.g4 [Trametes cinnabarina]
MARPPGCTFLGASATTLLGRIHQWDSQSIPIIVDSGSDITLISQRTLNKLSELPRIRNGQKVQLVQVTGNATITGYIPLDVYFETKGGTVKMSVEAYVVKGMTTPMILGNNFADQYSISILRNEGETSVTFSDAQLVATAYNSVGPPLQDEQGHAFQVCVRTPRDRYASTKKTRLRRIKQWHARRARDRSVRAKEDVVIPSGVSRLVDVQVSFPDQVDTLYVERSLHIVRNVEDVYGAPNTLIHRKRPAVHVANLLDSPIRIGKGQSLGMARRPNDWLDSRDQYDDEQYRRIEAHANVVRQLVVSQIPEAARSFITKAKAVDLPLGEATRVTEEDPLAENLVEGGPKTAEAPPEDTAFATFIQDVDISEELTPSQREQLLQVIIKNQTAFSLDGRLGTIKGSTCSIPLRPGAKEVSLPPFPSSPAKCEVMDAQMDKWIELDVIEPSVSPWGAPAFIVYRNGKPHMVVDYRKLNELTIPDEFPLPRQEDIMHALSGAQWLSTMDTLAGFTQTVIDEADRAKTAFRTHRGLHQFKRMPFGLRNGPSIFQRIMQGVLAPYLWMFTLVYIDDIVVYSSTPEEHIQHLDQVLSAIAEAGVTLAPSKCHFAYRSLMLLGQKVSRLGLSTHQEKVQAITNLAPPRNVSDLHTFLGMMVYFSAYIPFYAWIAAPLFDLLKKEREWDWQDVHQEVFELCKQVLLQAPVRAHAILGLPYRVYSDACDYGLAAILQQVQPIAIRDLKGTRVHEHLQPAYKAGETVPVLVTQVAKGDPDIPPPGPWADNFDETIVHIERVVAYWSRILKAAERNYSPTEREALALKEGLIKFQPYIEGEEVLAITDHAALTWSKTFQNVNRRLLTWGTVFATYPKLRIVHRAGRVHSNVDPISHLRRRVPHQDGPFPADQPSLVLGDQLNDPLKNTFDELGPRFEERLLKVAAKHVRVLEANDSPSLTIDTTDSMNPYLADPPERVSYTAAISSSLVIGIAPAELRRWQAGYREDGHFSKVLDSFQDDDLSNPAYPQYHLGDEGLIYFEDWNSAHRLCIPASLQLDVTRQAHDNKTEGAHGGYHRTYNRIASTYYWPRMLRDIKKYTPTCDICQKAKPRRHAPVGLLQPIPITSRPFEVVSMDFIPELPNSRGYDNCLVIVDKLTKYALFIPTTTTVSAEDTAKLLSHHVVAHYGLPRQVITDRDTQWRNDFWGQLCKHMDIRHALTTAHHPQSDGQTEVLNQTLEITLRAYISQARNNWSDHLDGLMLSYNCSPHTATTFSPAYLLHGYTPVTEGSAIRPGDSIVRPTPQHLTGGGEPGKEDDMNPSLHQVADEMAEQFNADRHRAQQALALGQAHQRKAYNKGRLCYEFEEGDLVVLNPHSLQLLRRETGQGRKLLMKYDGPFEVIQKVSAVAYRLRLPVSYGIHPVINIAHLEPYRKSPSDLGERPIKRLSRADFEDLPEVEVERIVGQKWKKGKNGRHIVLYKVRFAGFDEDEDEWLTKEELRNAPTVLREWLTRHHKEEARALDGGTMPQVEVTSKAKAPSATPSNMRPRRGTKTNTR